MGEGVLIDPRLNIKYRFDDRFVDNLRWSSKGRQFSLTNQDQPVTILGRQIEVMGGHQDGQAFFPVQAGQQVEDPDLLNYKTLLFNGRNIK